MGESNNKSPLEKIKERLFSIDLKSKVKLLVLVAVLVIIGVLYINYSNTDNNVSTLSNIDYGYYVSSLDYCDTMEQKLENVLSGLSGVGDVQVMVTLESSMELVFANTTEEKINNSTATNSYTVQITTPLIVETSNGQMPIVIKEVLPKVKGVLVVCSGVNNVGTKLDVIHAVQSLLDVKNSNIQVLFGK